ncbi:hypothetical protein [Pseudodesulfovibrio senegalensis]|uniref:Lipoprotein n=1 Tax=Pseudodesulfovibrio senegalensis TaxID=1721087 RepID=A0A6N6N758_9BACT|nr:hypothetical protein [Pseudodesulfovibrio senegalensis]KAB1443275.1 hypothetical protein F8A88_03145 [Pseudodesulfovibrio senegalensis]
MKRLTARACILVFGFSLLVMAGCGKSRPEVTAPRPQGKLVVAMFTSPTSSMDLLAGYLPEEGKPVDPEVLAKLDSVVQGALNEHGVMNFTPAAVTRQCQNVVEFKDAGIPRMSAFNYWVNVGKCMTADYILVPQVLSWREREGGEGGVRRPASVTIDLYLINVKERTMLRGHYSETQQALSENLLNAGKFFDRGAKWVSALELAKEGIDEKLMEIGL